MLVTTWGLFKPYLSHENIERDGNLLTAAWKELGKAEVHSVNVDPTAPTDDKELVMELAAALAEADVLVAHNGDSFDLPWVNARLAFHGLQPLPPLRSVDTLSIAKRYFRFSSNRMDALGEYLGLGRKIKTSYSLWKDVMEGDEAALAQMVKYNKQDVKLLEKLYLRLRPFMLHHPNYNLVIGGAAGAAMKCPTCGGSSMEKRGSRILNSTLRQRYHCTTPTCGAWSYGGKAIAKTSVGS